MIIEIVLSTRETSGRPIRAAETIGTAAGVALKAFEHHKHLASVNAGLDSFLGPML
jgi:predicted homoserine dehydrogenase-like protein